ncbi:MAG: DNRLRE domain-containing protein, partial [Actinobacteria bacterium]|nr:DNRLRE domain-containing protein [Actinomycetota bacterium]
GGGNCQGGIFGDGDRPHPTDQLFVQNQSDIADFPCFSKTFLNFDLAGIPAGKKIVSATLTLHSFGGSDPSQAKPSQIQLLTVDESWDESTLTWNNAPMARENVSVATVDVLKGFPGWPGVPFSWDATQAVAEAYAAGKSANLALYSTDSAYHSGKYFVSSDTGDWNAEARPTLTVSWADK